MPLLPKTPADWTRAFAYPLFGMCILMLFASPVAIFGGGDRVWYYAGAFIGGELLPLSGVCLGLTCLYGSGLDKTFRRIALVVAGLSVVYGPMWIPALAE